MSDKKLHGNHSAKDDDEWNTPHPIIEAARTVLGDFDLDPASNELAQTYIQAKRYYTIDNDGLTKPWSGRVWMNPPYSRIVKQFINKLVEEAEAERITAYVTITNNGTETLWGQRLLNHADAVCLVKGRTAFLKGLTPMRQNNKGQMICYHGPNPQLFKQVFSAYGRVLFPIRNHLRVVEM